MSTHAKVAQLVLAHHGFVKGLAVRIAPWPGLADDITQQVFLEFLKKEAKWDLERRQEYFEWAKRVIDRLRGAPGDSMRQLEAAFDAAFRRKP